MSAMEEVTAPAAEEAPKGEERAAEKLLSKAEEIKVRSSLLAWSLMESV